MTTKNENFETQINSDTNGHYLERESAPLKQNEFSFIIEGEKEKEEKRFFSKNVILLYRNRTFSN